MEQKNRGLPSGQRSWANLGYGANARARSIWEQLGKETEKTKERRRIEAQGRKRQEGSWEVKL